MLRRNRNAAISVILEWNVPGSCRETNRLKLFLDVAATGSFSRASALADIALIAPTAPNGARMLLEEEARRRGMRLNIVQEVNSASLVKRITARGDYCMVATWPWVATEVAAGALSASRIVSPVLRQTFCLAVGGRRQPSAAVRAVADIVRELLPSKGWQTNRGTPA